MTLTIEQHQQLSDKISEFEQIIFEPPYWLDDDPDGEYCLECAKLKKKEHPDWQLDGGWAVETDSVMFCATCEKPLEHSLTDYGVETELDFFEAEGADLESEVTRHTLSCAGGGYLLSNAERLYKIIFGDL